MLCSHRTHACVLDGVAKAVREGSEREGPTLIEAPTMPGEPEPPNPPSIRT